MTIHSHHRISAGARIVASLSLALGVTGSVSCYTGRANPATSFTSVSRELLPLGEQAMRYANLYDAITYLRPEYLRVREQGPTLLTPVAYVDGVRLADPTMLRHVPVRDVVEVRWVRPNRTSTLYRASHHLGGGIFVRTKWTQ